MSRVYKILPRADWDAAGQAGVFHGSPLDFKDGFIHLSTAIQAAETARLHFRDQADLILVGFEAEGFGDALKWEASRGGQLFPHLYGPLPVAAAVSVDPLPLDAEGTPQVPNLEP